jgi:hypothetical protein
MKNMKLSVILFSFLTLCAEVSAQKEKQELELLSYNVGFGILTTTVGAIINKPNEQGTWECIKKVWWQGATGGFLQYAGKKLTYQINKNENYWWGWPSKIIHSAGTSICHNASMGRPLGEYWVLDYGPVRCNFLINDDRLHVHPQFNLLFAYDLYWGLYFGKPDWNISLKTGTFAFTSDRERFDFDNGIYATGLSYSRSLVYANRMQPQNKYRILSHEIIHTYQANEYRVTNTYFYPLQEKINNKTINKIFQFVYFEIPVSYAVYGFFFNKQNYYKNIFEFEAEFFATDKYIER